MRPLSHTRSTRRSVSTYTALRLAAPALLCALGFAQTDAPRPPVQPDRYTETVQPFIQRHCRSCHSDRSRKGELSLQSLAPTFDLKTSPVWTAVYDRLLSGEMPPKKRKRPPAADVRAVLDWIGANLSAAETSRMMRIRRLNRTEYGNSVRDLLSVDLRVDGVLPEDAESRGFDNVGSALAISPELMGAYLEAAGLALDEAIVTHPQPETVLIEMDLRRHARLTPHLMLETSDAAVIFHSESYVGTDFNDFVTPVNGRYRLRVRAYAWQSDEPMVMAVRTLNDPLRMRGLVGFYEVESRPRVFEIEARLKKNDILKITPFRTGLPRFTNPWQFDGPGIAIQSLAVEGPIIDEWPPPSHTELFGDLDISRGTLDDAREVLARFVPKAFRRPVSDAEVAPYVNLVQAQLEQGTSFAESIRAGLQAVLCAPEFLFLGLPVDAGDGKTASSPYDLASRLSYFLWSSIPDEALIAAAGSGELQKPDVLAQHVERMLDDPRSAAFVDNFAGQWLDLRDIDFTSPDPALYPEFDELLKISMLEETQRFFRTILDEDLSVLNFVHSDFSILNNRLAAHYGIDGVTGIDFRRVALPESAHRGGVLTHGSVLKVTANGTNTSPIIRGVWVMENILGTPPPSPPATVPAFEPSIVGAKTIREQLAMHRSIESCRHCHQDIDPPGFALESYNVIGGWRDRYRTTGEGEAVDLEIMHEPVTYKIGLPVDASGETRDGRKFDDIAGFKGLLLADPDVFTKCLTEKLLTYGRGRANGFIDRDTVREIMRAVDARGLGFRTMIHEVARRLQ